MGIDAFREIYFKKFFLSALGKNAPILTSNATEKLGFWPLMVPWLKFFVEILIIIWVMIQKRKTQNF